MLNELTEDEIRIAIESLELSTRQFQKVPEEDAFSKIRQIERHFVAEPGYRWWWEHYKHRRLSAAFKDYLGRRYLSQIIPRSAKESWLVAEKTGHEKGFLLYAGTVEAIQKVLLEAWSFEYYIVSKELRWLVSENHHGYVSAIGDAAIKRLQSVIDQFPDRIVQSYYVDHT